MQIKLSLGASNSPQIVEHSVGFACQIVPVYLSLAGGGDEVAAIMRYDEVMHDVPLPRLQLGACLGVKHVDVLVCAAR